MTDLHPDLDRDSGGVDPHQEATHEAAQYVMMSLSMNEAGVLEVQKVGEVEQAGSNQNDLSD